MIQYIPRKSLFIAGNLWIAPSSTKLLIEIMLKGLLPELIQFPRSDLSPNLECYIIDNKLINTLLEPFYLIEEPELKYVTINQNTARIISTEFGKKRDEFSKEKTLLTEQLFQDVNRILIESSLGDSIELKNEDNVIYVFGYKSKGNNERTPSYESIIIFFIYLKAFYQEKLLFQIITAPSYSVKIVRNDLWTIQDIVTVMIRTVLLSPTNIDVTKRKQVSNYGIYKYPLTPSGIIEVNRIFGRGIEQSEFIVRSFRKAELITSDPHTLKLTSDILQQNNKLFKVNQRTLTSIAIEGLKEIGSYFDVMKLYFTLKLLRGVVLISEINPQAQTIGVEAMYSISKFTEFGGGAAPIHIISEKNPLTENIDQYIVGYSDAVESMLAVIPDTVRRGIVLQEIRKGILARKLTGSSFVFLFYLLD